MGHLIHTGAFSGKPTKWKPTNSNAQPSRVRWPTSPKHAPLFQHLWAPSISCAARVAANLARTPVLVLAFTCVWNVVWGKFTGETAGNAEAAGLLVTFRSVKIRRGASCRQRLRERGEETEV